MQQGSANSASIRGHNLSLILDLLRRKGHLSRADIIRETQLSPTTVSALVNLLIAGRLVREFGVGDSSGGRPPILVGLDPESRFVLGVDMGASHVTVVAMGLGGKLAARCHRHYDVIPDPEGSIRMIIEMVEEVLQSAGINPEQVLGLGVTIPAPLDGDQLDELMTYYMPAWKGVVLPEVLGERFSMPISFDNDANAGAVAESWWGAGRSVHSLAFIKTGIGVGSGLIVHNEIYRGFSGAAGEIGHTTIDPDGRVCRCGNQGCMEAYVGAPGLVDAVDEARVQAGLAPLEREQRNVQAVVSAAVEGDAISRQVIEKAGEYLGIAVANLINLLNPGKVVLNGGLVAAGDLFFTPLRATVASRVLPIDTLQPEMVPSELGEDAIAIGAATIAMRDAFQPDRLYLTLGLVERR